jgi:glycosyltransferase involved in cell wall biosynthesis
MIAFAPNHHTTRWARALRATGLDVHVVCMSSPDEDYGLPGIPVHPVPKPPTHLPIVASAAVWYETLRQISPDVVYMQWLFARPAMLLALDPQWPLVVTVMGSDVLQDRSLRESWLDRSVRTALLLRAHTVTAAARPLAQVVARYHPSLAARIHIVPFGVDTRRFTPGPVRTSPGPLRIGHFKSDDPVYGRIDLLRAVEPLVREGRPIRLHLAGKRGNDDGSVAQFLIAHPHVQACVVDHGLVSVDAMPALYRDLDVYVLSSQQESFGVAAAEALACGVPVIASDIGGVRALVQSGSTGLLVPAGDVQALRQALVELAELPDLRASCGQRGRLRVQRHFEWSETVDHMARLIRGAACDQVTAPAA